MVYSSESKSIKEINFQLYIRNYYLSKFKYGLTDLIITGKICLNFNNFISHVYVTPVFAEEHVLLRKFSKT